MPIGLMTDTRTKEWTAQEAVKKLRKHGVRNFADVLNLCLNANGGGKQVVAVLYARREISEILEYRVVKYRANSGRWTQPVWVRAADIVPPKVKEKRYRDALASLLAVQ